MTEEEERGCRIELAGLQVEDEGSYRAIFPAWSVKLRKTLVFV